MGKTYKISYIDYKISNAFIVPMFFLICIVVDWLDFIKNDAISWGINILFALIVVYFYNKFSNVAFKRTGYVIIYDNNIGFDLTKNKIIYEFSTIKEVSLSFNKQFLRKYIQLTIKPYSGKSLKLISERYILDDDLQRMPFTEIFLNIKELCPFLTCEEMFGSTYFTLTNEAG